VIRDRTEGRFAVLTRAQVATFLEQELRYAMIHSEWNASVRYGLMVVILQRLWDSALRCAILSGFDDDDENIQLYLYYCLVTICSADQL